MSKRIGLFGGTFDPVHNGHIAIVKAFLDSQKIDELWVLLTPFPPHKQEKEHVSYEHRKKMIGLAFQDIKGVEISTIEQDLPKPSYTIRTIQHLKSENKDDIFLLCIGEDSLANFSKWKDYQNILEECDLLVAERPDNKHAHVDDMIMEKVHFVKHEPVEASSTLVRSLISAGSDAKQLLPQKVYKYILDNKLYQ